MGVGDALSAHSAAEAKGIKAHFRMDESGLLLLDNVRIMPFRPTAHSVCVFVGCYRRAETHIYYTLCLMMAQFIDCTNTLLYAF